LELSFDLESARIRAGGNAIAPSTGRKERRDVAWDFKGGFMKKLLGIALLLLLVMGYVACGGGGGYSSSGPTAPSYQTPTPGMGPTPTPVRY
jgi:hypothetical protein